MSNIVIEEPWRPILGEVWTTTNSAVRRAAFEDFGLMGMLVFADTLDDIGRDDIAKQVRLFAEYRGRLNQFPNAALINRLGSVILHIHDNSLSFRPDLLDTSWFRRLAIDSMGCGIDVIMKNSRLRKLWELLLPVSPKDWDKKVTWQHCQELRTLVIYRCPGYLRTALKKHLPTTEIIVNPENIQMREFYAIR